jgi:invasion protein IalB
MLIRSTLLRTFISVLGITSLALPAAAQTKVEPAKPAVAEAAAPSEPTVTTASYGSWVLRCVQLLRPAPAAADANKTGRDGGQACEVVQTVQVQVQGQAQPFAQIAIGRVPGEKELTVTVLVPVNIALPGAIHLSANGKTGEEEKGRLELLWQRCIAGSCAASAKPDTAILSVFRTGTEGQLRFVDASGQLAAIPLSWKGLDQAMAALDKTR